MLMEGTKGRTERGRNENEMKTQGREEKGKQFFIFLVDDLQLPLFSRLISSRYCIACPCARRSHSFPFLTFYASLVLSSPTIHTQSGFLREKYDPTYVWNLFWIVFHPQKKNFSHFSSHTSNLCCSFTILRCRLEWKSYENLVLSSCWARAVKCE